MNIKQYIEKNGFIIVDGAMGTYYYEKTGNENSISEFENINNPDIIKNIHQEYINAGAMLIRTNSFAANKRVLNIDSTQLEKVILGAVNAAKRAVNEKSIYIAGSIGPIPEKGEESSDIIENEYFEIIDFLLNNGIDIFVFETFSSYERVLKCAEYIKSKNNSAFIIAQFAVLQNGETRKGISNREIISVMRNNSHIIDGFGFNCGTGPMPLFNNLKTFDFSNEIVSVLPNAGFPELINERTVYSQSKEYFAEQMNRIKSLGVKILGGCCGTTPEHIKQLSKLLSMSQSNSTNIEHFNNSFTKQNIEKNIFLDKINSNKFLVAVELDPPFNGDMTKISDAAKIIAATSADIITVSDSPMGKSRVSPVITAARIKRESGIDTMPHICCRDRNITALKSDIIGGFSESIKNFLFVTGDPIPSAERNEVKSVFNFNSIGLMELAGKMNQNEFNETPINFGGALNLNVLKKEIEIERMLKKRNAGAAYFLTQPVFSRDSIEFIKSNGEILKKCKVLVGIMPLVSYNNAQFLNNEIPGITIPDSIINLFNKDMSRETAEKTGIDIALNTALEIKDYVAGFYFITPFNRAEMIKQIIEKLNLDI